MSHDTEELENSPESPHLGEIKHMRKQCAPGAPTFFDCTGMRLQLTMRHCKNTEWLL